MHQKITIRKKVVIVEILTSISMGETYSSEINVNNHNRKILVCDDVSNINL